MNIPTCDSEAIEQFLICSRLEGIIPALEPAHALAYANKIVPKMKKKQIVIINMCGRGDKDLDAVIPMLQKNKKFQF